MKVIRYGSLAKLKKAADDTGISLYETDISYSYRIYHGQGKTKEFHVFYKH